MPPDDTSVQDLQATIRSLSQEVSELRRELDNAETRAVTAKIVASVAWTTFEYAQRNLPRKLQLSRLVEDFWVKKRLTPSRQTTRTIERAMDVVLNDIASET